MELVKLKRQSNRKGYDLTEEGLRKRKEASRRHMILNNPMKNLESRNKISIKLKGRIVNLNNLFKKGNQYGKLRKNTKIGKTQKMKQSMKMRGRKLHSKQHKEKLRERMILNNPMRDPEVAKKVSIKLKENAKKKYRNHRVNKLVVEYITHLGKGARNRGCKERAIVKIYNEGLNCQEVGKIVGLTRPSIRKILIKNDIKIRNNFFHGKPRVTEKFRRTCREKMILDNPMKKPEIVEKTINSKRIKRNLISPNIILEYRRGMPISKLSIQYRVSYTTIRKILSENCISIRKGYDKIYKQDLNTKKNE